MRLFIEAVRQHPCLWNPSLSDYRDYAVKDSAWQDVIDAVKMDAISNIHTAKLEWKKLRDNHRDSIKRAKSGTGLAATYGNQWRYAKAMEFLLPYMKNSKAKTDSSYSSAPYIPPSSQPPIAPSQSYVPPASNPMYDSDHSSTTEQEPKDTEVLKSACNEDKNVRKRKKYSGNINLLNEKEESDNLHTRELIAKRHVVEKPHPLDSFFQIQSAKTAWKKLRDTHRDSIKRAKAGVGQTALYGNQWRYAKIMTFLLPYMKHRKPQIDSSQSTILSTLSASQTSAPSQTFVPPAGFSTRDSDHSVTTEHEPENSSDVIEITYNQDKSAKNIKKDSDNVDVLKETEHSHNLKKQNIELKIVEEVHPLDGFFQSMLHSAKEMPPWMQINVKRKIFNIVADAEDYLEKIGYDSNN